MCYCIQTINPCKLVKARKDYEDSAGVWISEQLSDIRNAYDYKLTFTEWRAIAKLKANGWKIKKGQIHKCGVFKHDGEIYSWRALPEIQVIAYKYELIQCEC